LYLVGAFAILRVRFSGTIHKGSSRHADLNF
jgi:hypothetical protein